jgi:cyanophycin synthetase
MNVYDEHPFKVIFDYAHNAHAVAAMAELSSRLEVRGRRIVVVAGPGDRRDEDIRAIANSVAGRFDHYICRRDDNLRGRAGDEVPTMIAQTLRSHGVPQSALEIIPDEQAAVEAALRLGRPGDLLLVFADALTRSWKQIIKFKPEAAADSMVPARSEPVRRVPRPAPVAAEENASFAVQDDAAFEAQGFVRDERGLHFVGEAAD